MVRAIIDRRPFHAPFPQTNLARLNELLGCSHKAGRRLPNPISPNGVNHRHLECPGDDDIWHNFSWNGLIDSLTLDARLKRVLRDTVWKNQAEYRAVMIDTGHSCTWCGSLDDPTADHIDPPFDSIALAFTSHHGKTIELAEGPNCIGEIIADIKAEWSAWHARPPHISCSAEAATHQRAESLRHLPERRGASNTGPEIAAGTSTMQCLDFLSSDTSEMNP